MPKLVRLYITSVAIGFAISAAFVVTVVALDVAGLRHLVLGTDMGWLAGLMMFMFNGIVFAGVQFAIRIMAMAENDRGPGGGLRQWLAQRGQSPIVAPIPAPIPAPVPVQAGSRRKTQR